MKTISELCIYNDQEQSGYSMTVEAAPEGAKGCNHVDLVIRAKDFEAKFELNASDLIAAVTRVSAEIV